jgi:REP element-mobilizing transposase RayT
MTNYRRNQLAGGCFFFTVNLAERHLRLLTEHIDQLRTAFRQTRKHHPLTIDAMVVLPDHLHAVWTLPEGDADFATRWRLIKSAFSRSFTTGERISQSRAASDGRAGEGLAVFVVPSYGEARRLSRRLGGRCLESRRGIRRAIMTTRSKPMGFARAQPILRAGPAASLATGAEK